MTKLMELNFDAMTGPQLVEQYNQMAATLGRDAVRKFENKTIAIARCETLRAILDDVIIPAATPRKMPNHSPVTKAVTKMKTAAYNAMDGLRDVLRGADPDQTAARVLKSHEEAKAEAAPVAAKTVAKPVVKPTQTPAADRDARVIHILTRDEANPRREGTDAHRHFEAMRGGRTVAQYLDEFDQAKRKVARHWLYNTVKDGHVKVGE